jgi:hypothetical protein
MGVPHIFAGQAGPLPLQELDDDFAALANGTAFISPFELDGSPGLPVSLRLKDGQAGNTIWSVNVGVNAVGEFEIIDVTAGTTPLSISTAGTVTIAQPPSAIPALFAGVTSPAVPFAGGSVASFNGGPTTFGAGAVVIVSGTNTNNVGLQCVSRNKGEALTVTGFNSAGNSLGMTVLAGTNNTDANTGWGSADGTIQFGAILGDGSFVVGGGVNPTGLGLGTLKASGIIQASAAVAPAAGGSASCGIRASSTANLGIFFGTGAPTFAAAQGSIYSNITGGAGARLYVNTNGSTTWAAAASP